MIVSNTPPPSKYWSDKQLDMYDCHLKDKNSTLAYYMTTKDGLPLHSPNKKGWKAKVGLLQKVEPNKYGEIQPCTSHALHATFDIKHWILLDCKIWVVAMLGKVVNDDDKIASLQRKIIGCYHPSELSNETRLVAYPQYDLNQKIQLFDNVQMRGATGRDQLQNIDFTGSSFKGCRFVGISFVKCNFSNVSFRDCDFATCKFINCNFNYSTIKGNSHITNVKIIGKVENFNFYSDKCGLPDGFEVENYRLVRIKKGKKNV